MSEQMNVVGDISKLLSLCFSLRLCSEALGDCAVFCLPLFFPFFFSCLPVDVCVISGECCKGRNERGVAHNEHKTHTELWDVNCLTVYCLLLAPRRHRLRLLTATEMCSRRFVSQVLQPCRLSGVHPLFLKHHRILLYQIRHAELKESGNKRWFYCLNRHKHIFCPLGCSREKVVTRRRHIIMFLQWVSWSFLLLPDESGECEPKQQSCKRWAERC